MRDDSADDFAFLIRRCRIMAGRIVRSCRRMGESGCSEAAMAQKIQNWMFVRFGNDVLFRYLGSRNRTSTDNSGEQWCRWIEQETVDHFLRRAALERPRDIGAAEREYTATVGRLRRLYEEETSGGPDMTRLVAQTCARLNRLQRAVDAKSPVDPMVASALRTCRVRLGVIPMLTTAVEHRETLGIVQAWLCGVEDRLTEPSLGSRIVSAIQTMGYATVHTVEAASQLVVGTTIAAAAGTVDTIGSAVSIAGSVVHTIGSGVRNALGK